MQAINFRHIIHILRYQVVLLFLVLLLMPRESKAQLNYLEYVNKKIYFGITLGMNTSKFKVARSNEFAFNDTIVEVLSRRGPGFNLGIVSNLKLGNYVDLRFIPTLAFADKKLEFHNKNGLVQERTIESINIEFPLMARLKSQPIKDVRLYVLAGMKYSIDLASNAKARRADDQIKILRSDISYELGFGIQIFFPLFIFSPEIKVANGIINVHSPNEKLVLSGMIDRLFTRTLIISLHFEG